MSTRHQARRRKGATRQARSPGWEPARKAQEATRRAEAEEWFLLGESQKVRDYWQPRIGDQATYVYLVQAVDQPAVKIGYAVNPVTRLAELQCGNAHELVIVALLLGSKQTERVLHNFWRQARVRGEWFGNGYEHAILEMADTICFKQILDYGEGCDLAYVRDSLPTQILECASA